MKIHFTKMHGLGNDFIVVDCRGKAIRALPRAVKVLSERRFGVGFDQALVLKGSRKADFRMEVYNADGGRVEMCGNGIRCLARYIWSRGLSRKKRLEIETLAGIIRPEKVKDMVRVDMGVPVLEGKLIPVAVDYTVIDRPLRVGDREFLITCVSMGNPHCAIFVDAVDEFPVARYGPLIETDVFFPKRTNVEFIEVLGRARIKMRVWERGSGETLACGTGAAAAAVAAHEKGLVGRTVTAALPGGRLKIELANDGHVYMTGPAEEVYTGVAVV
jgi:diaminopimelate epimerase